ncbi:MAG: DUF4058 family protein [Chloroflexota bacterium]
MQPVRAIKNQYPGINAHLHSYWQGAKKWNRFHNVYIADLMGRLKAALIPIGYTAAIEESLQIRTVGEEWRDPQSDILIRDESRERSLHPQRPSISAAPIMDIEDLLGEQDLEHPYYAVAIFERHADGAEGKPVAWIELLSPTNKRGSSNIGVYFTKRQKLLESGLVFVELDYLHETPPTFWRLDDYSRHESNSHPYRIVVIEPRPDMKQGWGAPYEFDVDAVIPSVKIPLNGSDVLEFDFGDAYQQTWEFALYGYDMDYSQLPMNFDRYHPDDQARILARMLAVLKAVRDGVDLETHAPLPVESISVEEGLKQLAEWTA